MISLLIWSSNIAVCLPCILLYCLSTVRCLSTAVVSYDFYRLPERQINILLTQSLIKDGKTYLAFMMICKTDKNLRQSSAGHCC